MAFTRQNYPGYVYTNEALRKHDEELMKTPEPEHHIEVIASIVTGKQIGRAHV